MSHDGSVKEEIYEDILMKEELEDKVLLPDQLEERLTSQGENSANDKSEPVVQNCLQEKMSSLSTSLFRDGLNTHKVWELLEEDKGENFTAGDIICHIPELEKDALVDEDSDDSKDDLAGEINHFGRGLLNTHCKFMPKGRNVEEDNETVSITNSSANQSTNKRLKIDKNLKWGKTVPVFDIIVDKPVLKPLPDCVMSSESELDIFKLFFCETFIQNIVHQTNLYAQQRNTTLNVSTNEMWVMFGGFLLSGYAKYPNKRLYWSCEKDTPTILSDAIRCNRFEEILHHIHFNDNANLDNADKLFKLRPILDHFSKTFLEFNPLDEHISIGESMMPYFGRHFAKQSIKGKPIRFGFKNWTMCSSTGYMYAFDVCIGKASMVNKPGETNYGVGGQTVLNLIKKGNIPKKSGYKVYFDHYFTSYNLLCHLSEIGICATGTIRENRLQNCPLPKNVAFKKKTKGSIDIASTTKVLAIKYKDNNVLTLATNYDSSTISSTKRFSKEKQCYIQVPQPTAVKHYNSFMGGVDQMDQWVESYRTRMQQKKWWWPIFIYFFDVAVVNAWLLWKKSKNNRDPLLQFRRRLAISILKIYGSVSSQGNHQPLIQPPVRYDGQNHWLRPSNQRRCRYCTGKSTFSCSKCDVGLHPKCQEAYHTR